MLIPFTHTQRLRCRTKHTLNDPFQRVPIYMATLESKDEPNFCVI